MTSKIGRQHSLALAMENLPKTVEEFMKLEGLTDWPHSLTSEGPLDLSEEKGSLDEVKKELALSTPIDLKVLNDLEGRLDAFDELLLKYADKILELGTEKTAEQGLVPVLEETEEEEDEEEGGEKAFLTDVPNQSVPEEPSAQTAVPPRSGNQKVKKSRNQPVDKSPIAPDAKKNQITLPPFGLKKSISNCAFPGFKSHEFTELPSQLEAPQILNRVSRAQKFSRSFGEMWKKIFLSEASVAVLNDTFWWIYLDKFQSLTIPTPERQLQQANLFNRIADNFVSLFVSVNPEVKDKVFQNYVDCFAQALYASYYEAFPDSLRLLQDDFKEYVVNLASVWVTGCSAAPGASRNWDVEKIVPREKKNKNESKKDQLARELTLDKPVSLSLDMDSFFETLDRLSKVEPEAAGPSRVSEWMEQSKKDGVTDGSGKNGESHMLGPGANYTRVRFKLAGRSPLVNHFLRMRKLLGGDQGREMKRLEVKPEADEGQKTYRDVVQETKDRNHQRVTHYQQLWDDTEKEIAAIEAQKRETARRIEMLEQKLQSCKGSMEIKLFADKHLDQNEVDGRWVLRDDAFDEM